MGLIKRTIKKIKECEGCRRRREAIKRRIQQLRDRFHGQSEREN